MPNQPISGNDLARFAGPQTFMRLPEATSPEGLDVCFMGIPMDIGTSWRSGTRFGPKQIRQESAMIRPYNLQTGAAPFDSLQMADLGDVPINTFSLADSLKIIEAAYDKLHGYKVLPATMGGDHSLTLPILRSIAKKHGPVALVHIDAHADVNDEMFGERETHGTVFRRAYEEGLLYLSWFFRSAYAAPVTRLKIFLKLPAGDLILLRLLKYGINHLHRWVVKLEKLLGTTPAT